jgi:hypothetical protein
MIYPASCPGGKTLRDALIGIAVMAMDHPPTDPSCSFIQEASLRISGQLQVRIPLYGLVLVLYARFIGFDYQYFLGFMGFMLENTRYGNGWVPGKVCPHRRCQTQER